MTMRTKSVRRRPLYVRVGEIDNRRDPLPGSIPKHVAVPVAVVLAALTWFAFAPVLENGFVDIDDHANFLDNHAFRGLGWPQVVTAFTTPRIGVYQPLGSLFLSAQYLCCGLDPSGYHATSLGVHALNAVVLYGLVLALLGRWKPTLVREHPRSMAVATGLAVAWFSAHPMRAEPVAWATAQLYLPCALFAMFSMLAYVRAHPPGGAPRSPRWLAGSYGLALISMLFMPGAVCLPFLFLVLDASLLGRFDRDAGGTAGRARGAVRLVAEKLPLLVPAVALMGVAYWAKRSSQVQAHLEHDGLWARLAQAGYGVWFYLGKMAAPFGLSAFYPRPERGDFRAPVFAAVVIGLIVVSAAVAALRARVRWLPAVWLAYLLTLAPHLGLIRVGSTVAADRYAYLASIVWVIPLAAGLAWLARLSWPGRVRPATLTAGLVLVVGLAFLSRAQARTWHDSETLWIHALRCAPRSSQTHANLAAALGESGKYAESVAESDAALAIWPEDVETLVRRGVSLAGQGQLDEAMASYRRALELRPDDANACFNLGSALAACGKYDEAIALYRRALAIEPGHAEVDVKLGGALLAQGKRDEAMTAFREALRLKPWHAEAHTSLGAILAMQGDLEGAIAEYHEALVEDPNHVAALVNLGIALAQSGRPGMAIAPIEDALRIDPGLADAHHALGAIFAGLGRLNEARAEFSEVLRLKPDHAQASLFLAQVRRQLGEAPPP